MSQCLEDSMCSVNSFWMITLVFFALHWQCQKIFKLPYNCTHFTSSKVLLKILQARLQQYVNWELPDVQAGFRIGRGTRDLISKISWRKQENFRKTSTSASLTTLKPLTVWITTNCGKFWKRWEHQTTLPFSWETCIQDKKQWLEPDMEQLTDSKLEKEYIKAVYCHPAYLTYMQSTSCEMLGWMKHKLESRLPGEMSITSDMQKMPPWQKARRT